MIVLGNYFHKFTAHKFDLGSCYCALFCLVVAFFPLSSYAQEAGAESGSSPNIIKHGIEADRPYLSWAAGEIYDASNGTLNYSRNDLEIPGNGRLPIVIKRSFSQFQGPEKFLRPPTYTVGGKEFPTGERLDKLFASRSLFGYMQLQVPMLTMYRSNYPNFDACFRLPAPGSPEVDDSLRSDDVLDKIYGNTNFTIDFTDGGQEITFFHVNDINSHLATSEAGIQFDFISKDNWGLRCDYPHGPPLPSYRDNPVRLIIYNPNGIVYEASSYDRFCEGTVDCATDYYVGKITDQYGNSLTYDYEKMSLGSVPRYRQSPKRMFSPALLRSIISTDGRKVFLEYEAVETNTYKAHARIKKIWDNGSPNQRVIEYEYHDKKLKVIENGLKAREYQFTWDGRIESITYPAGGKVSYSYEKPEGVSKLKTRKSNPGSVFNFEYHVIDDLTSASLIRTPSGTKEFRFNNSRLNFGKPIRYRVFDDPNVSWSPTTNTSLLLDRTYKYKVLYKLTNLESYWKLTSDFRADKKSWRGDRNVLAEVGTRMNWSYADQRWRSLFVTDYAEYDTRGYLTQTIEYTGNSNNRRSRVIDMAYRHDGFKGWILGKPEYESIDRKDVTETQYNARGDVTSVTSNGKRVAEYRWHESGQGKGELYTITNGQGGKATYTDYYRGVARRLIDPVGRVLTRVVNDDGTIKSEKRADDVYPTAYMYDAIRRIIEVVPARQEDNRKTYHYDRNNQWHEEAPVRRKVFYDGFGRTRIDTTADPAEGRVLVKETRYDAEGRIAFEGRPFLSSLQDNGNSFATAVILSAESGYMKIGRTYEYDGLGRVRSVYNSSHSDGTTGKIVNNRILYSYNYANNGNLLLSEYDGRGKRTSTEYMSYGTPDYQWPVYIREGDGTGSVIKRNSLGKVESHTRGGMTTYYRYNHQNLVNAIVRGADSETTFDYFDDGSLKNRSNNGRNVRYHYYPDLKVKQEDHTDESGSKVIRHYSYNRNGNLQKMTVTTLSSSNSISYDYDDGDNLLSEVLQLDGLEFKMSYTYDGNSHRNSIQFPSGNRYALIPNVYGNPTAIKQYAGENQKTIYDSVSYNPNHSLSLLIRDASHRIENKIDFGQRLKEMSVRKVNGTGSASAPYLAEQYVYDESNNVRQINDLTKQQTSTFGYDERNRLTSAMISDGDNWLFKYQDSDDIDSIYRGRTLIDFVYNRSTRLLDRVEQNGVTRHFNYDNHGNMIQHERLSDTGGVLRTLLSFNAANEVVRMNDGTLFEYDARGLRVKKNRFGPIYSFYDQSERLIYRADVGAGVRSEYFYVGDSLVARRDMERGGAISNDPVPVSKPPPTFTSTPIIVNSSPSMTTPASPAAPTLQAESVLPATLWPADGGVSPTPQYQWSAVPSAPAYNLEVKKASAANPLFYITVSASNANCSSGRCNASKPDVPLNGTNLWRVRTQNEANKHYGQWSEWRTFTVKSSPSMATPTSPAAPTVQAETVLPATLWPANGGVSPTPQYQWSAVPSVPAYNLEVKKASGANPLFYLTVIASDANCSSGRCRASKPDVPLSGTNLWRVRAQIEVNKRYGQWSEWREFTTTD